MERLWPCFPSWPVEADPQGVAIRQYIQWNGSMEENHSLGLIQPRALAAEPAG